LPERNAGRQPTALIPPGNGATAELPATAKLLRVSSSPRRIQYSSAKTHTLNGAGASAKSRTRRMFIESQSKARRTKLLFGRQIRSISKESMHQTVKSSNSQKSIGIGALKHLLSPTKSHRASSRKTDSVNKFTV
jgi:hypothetical protein